MATVSNPATLQSVINTFGSGGSPTNLFAYRRGQSYVPDIPAYSGVSTTEPALSTFAGLVYPAVNLPNYADFYGPDIYLIHSLSRSPAVFDTIFAGVDVVLNSDGTGAYRYYDFDTFSTNFTSFTWLLTGSASDYYAYMDSPTNGGPFTSGTVGSPVQLNTTRSWSFQADAPFQSAEYKTLNSNLRIRNASNNDLIVKSLYMQVEATNQD